jgi:feruloyl esterase
MFVSAIRCLALTVAALLGLGGSHCFAASPTQGQCEQLAVHMTGRWPDPSTRVTSLQFFAESQPAELSTPGAPPLEVVLPAHCEVFGVLHERKGADGQLYAIHFHLRLPSVWNKRFYFQGGAGTNGEVGDALGALAGAVPALIRGYAVVSQDSGHDNRVNFDANKGGRTSFGFDAQARADYGHASLQPVSAAAKALVHAYYGAPPEYSYFVGCSKGGEEGMVAAQRLPLEFNGILAAAPGFSLPRAAIAEAWDVQSLASVAAVPLAHTFSDPDLALVSRAVLAACDADDGLADGIVGAFQQCSTEKVEEKLNAMACAHEKTSKCLSSSQIAALERVYAGPKDSTGRALYSNWPWDAGISGFGWRLWKLGSADGSMDAMNVTTGGASLASVFTTPPTALADNPGAQLKFAQQFDFDRDAPKIYATTAAFTHSAWDDISARSSDLSGFSAHGGKLLVPQGVSDPVFSINDTLAWYRDLDRRTGGQADTFARVFPVPGMNHCGGGPATDHFDAFASLVGWVEHQQPPDRIIARAGTHTPWPDRERPLCPYPKVARYKGSGNIERADNFDCR